MYNGFDWYGRILEVREDRFAGLSGFRGGRGGLRGLRGMGRGLGRGGFRGGYGGGGSGRDFSNQDIYADYSGPDQPSSRGGGAAAESDGYSGGFGNTPSGPRFGGAGAGGGAHFNAEPSQQIMVRNVCRVLLVTWSYC